MARPLVEGRPGWGVLANGPFRRLWIATTASGLATWALPFVLGLAVVEGSLTAAALGLVLGARTAGFLLAVPLGGVFADRWPRRRIVLVTGLLAAAATPVVAVALGRQLAVVAVAAVLVGAGQGACRPAFQALTAEVVSEDRRQRANAAITLAVRMSVLLGPGAAALLAPWLGIRWLILVTAALWLLAALVPPAGPGGTATGAAPRGDGAVAGIGTDFLAGVREARRHRWFPAGLVALAAVIATGYSVTGVLLPQLSRDSYGGGGVLAGSLTAYAAGALLGAVIIGRWRPRSAGWVALAGLGCYALAPVSLLLQLPAGMVIAAYAVVGLGIELFNVPWFTAIQREVRPAFVARVSSLDFLVSYGLAPIGLAVIAPAAQHFGVGPVLAASAVACVVVPLLAASVSTSRHFGPDPGRAPLRPPRGG